jgi:uncharacterized protein YdcH (DUF465 family)
MTNDQRIRVLLEENNSLFDRIDEIESLPKPLSDDLHK